jgi:hypothetical protein
MKRTISRFTQRRKGLIKPFLILSILTLEIGCSGVKVRFQNSSNIDFTKLTIKASKETHTFENLKSGQKTPFIRLDHIYRYCYAQVIVGKDTMTYQPYDYVGEIAYKRGWIELKFDVENRAGGEHSIQIKAKRIFR